MNQDVKQKWVAALRSGKFVQGRSKLKHTTDHGSLHCCLGVLCEIHDQVHSCGQSFEGMEGFPPEHVMNWAELPDPANLRFTFVRDDGQKFQESLIYLNDVRMYNFKQIADLIETQL